MLSESAPCRRWQVGASMEGVWPTFMRVLHRGREGVSVSRVGRWTGMLIAMSCGGVVEAPRDPEARASERV